MSELLVGSVVATARGLGMSQLFARVIVLAVVGNAAEHYSAMVLARRDQMDAAIGIAVGSSTQIALFVGPALVLLIFVVGPHPMDLLFSVFELVAIGVAVLSIASLRTMERRIGWRVCSCWRFTSSSPWDSSFCQVCERSGWETVAIPSQKWAGVLSHRA